jgi:hypothetical protein
LIAGPPMGTLGDNDEEEADKQNAASEPIIKRGATLGSRDKKGAKPLERFEIRLPSGSHFTLAGATSSSQSPMEAADRAVIRRACHARCQTYAQFCSHRSTKLVSSHRQLSQILRWI